MMNEEEARERVLDYQERTKKSQTQIAKEMGISNAYLNQFLKGTYAAPHTIIPKVEKLLGFAEKKEIVPKELGFCRTSISGTVMDLIAFCHIRQKTGVAYGDAGVGKTMAVREYKAQNPNTAIVITISPCFANVTGVNDLLAEELRIKEKISRKIYMEALRKLKGSNKVIIIDEAQHLTVRVINHLRSMADATGVGMAFVGNEEIYLKMKGSGEVSYSQYYSRIAQRKQVLTSQITRADIELVFRDSQLTPEAIGVLLEISRTNYGLRGAVNVFENTAVVFQTVTAKGIARMAREMGIG